MEHGDDVQDPEALLLTVGDVMTSPVRFLNEDATARDALAHAARSRVHHLPVGGANAWLGVLCTCDLRSAPPQTALRLLMRPAAIVMRQTDCATAVTMMRASGAGSLLVADAGEICGIVTRADVARRGANDETAGASPACACCGATEHPRPLSGGVQLCQDCLGPSKGGGEFETGDSD